MDLNVAEADLALRKQVQDDGCHGGMANGLPHPQQKRLPSRPLEMSSTASSLQSQKPLNSTTPSSSPQAQPNTASSVASASQESPGSHSIVFTAAVKRKRLTAAEREERDREAAEKKRKREEKKAEQDEKKAEQEEKKALLSKEREEKRRKREEEDRIKAEKKLKKEQEQKRLQEEKEKKSRSQLKLNSFFDRPKKQGQSTPDAGSEVGSPNAGSEVGSPKPPDTAPWIAKAPKSAYEKMKPFFCRKNTRLNTSVITLDEETRETKARSLENIIAGRDEAHAGKLSEIFKPSEKGAARGRLYYPVKHIMEEMYRQAGGSEGGGKGQISDNAFEEARKKLAKVPMKMISFSQDVRPPYCGTITMKPFAMGKGNMYRLARKPVERRLPLDYDFDSEAEWQDEEGEDVDMEDDDEEQDDEDDMDGFLDDSGESSPSRRLFSWTLEPESTGLCFESEDGLCRCLKGRRHRLEVMLGNEVGGGIDPWATHYWEPASSAKTKDAKDLRLPQSKSCMAPPAVPAPASHTDSNNRLAKLVKPALMNDVKQAILNHSTHSKMAIIDIVWRQFQEDTTRTEVKNTLELVAEKKGAGRLMRWDLKAGHGISQGRYGME